MNRNMRVVPDDVVTIMQRAPVRKTDEALQRAFGISYNTWRRIDRKEPIRSSVATRLVERLSQTIEF